MITNASSDLYTKVFSFQGSGPGEPVPLGDKCMEYSPRPTTWSFMTVITPKLIAIRAYHSVKSVRQCEGVEGTVDTTGHS